MKPTKPATTEAVQPTTPAPAATPAPAPAKTPTLVTLEEAEEYDEIEIEGETRDEHFKGGFKGIIENWVPRAYWRRLGPDGLKLHDFCLSQFRTRAFAKERLTRATEATVDLRTFEYVSKDAAPEAKVGKALGKLDAATLAALPPEVLAMVEKLKRQA